MSSSSTIAIYSTFKPGGRREDLAAKYHTSMPKVPSGQKARFFTPLQGKEFWRNRSRPISYLFTCLGAGNFPCPQ
jgi:hypothetical protein